MQRWLCPQSRDSAFVSSEGGAAGALADVYNKEQKAKVQADLLELFA